MGVCDSRVREEPKFSISIEPSDGVEGKVTKTTSSNQPIGWLGHFLGSKAFESADVPTANFKPVNRDAILKRAFSSIDAQEMREFTKAKNWLRSLLAAVETLPIPVSLVSVAENCSNCPFVYVNACFEYTSGYSRKEIVGQSYDVFHVNEEDSEKFRMHGAMRDAMNTIVAITNRRKDGTVFKTLMFLKPIFDTNGVFRYVIAVQLDISKHVATAAKLRLADELIRMLPSTIYYDEE